MRYKMKKIVSIMAAVLAAVILFTGCQTTPEQQVVIGKDMEQMLEKAQDDTSQSDESLGGSALSDRLNVPEVYQVADEYYDGRLSLHANAQIQLPEESQIPSVRVSAGEFDQDRVNALYDVLVEDAQMYTRSDERTKAQLEKAIISKKEYIERIKAGDSFGDESPDLELEEKSLKELEKAYQTAPETFVSVAADATLQSSNNGGTVVNLSGEDAKGNVIYFSADNPEDDTQASFEFYRGASSSEKEWIALGPYELVEDTLSDGTSKLLGMSLDEAKAAAIQFFANIGEDAVGIGDMQICYQVPVDFFSTPTASEEFYRLSEDTQVERLEESAAIAYVEFTCYRLVNGVPVSSQQIDFQTGVSEGEEVPEYMKEWAYEEIILGVSARGIETVTWNSPLDILETITDQTNLMPFEQIDEIFRQMFKVKYSELFGSSIQSGGILSSSYEITDVRLTLRRIREQNSTETGYLIPVWDFYGKNSIEYNGEPEQTFEEKEPLLTINAIDGSVIDLSKGY